MAGGVEAKRGYAWAHGMPFWSSMNTILPPNREQCGWNGVSSEGIYPPGSRHQGGCHVLMGDGDVILITDSIEAGDSQSAQVVDGTPGGAGGLFPGEAELPFADLISAKRVAEVVWQTADGYRWFDRAYRE